MRPLPTLIFTLPNRRDAFGILHRERSVMCECIRGVLAEEIQQLWEAYRESVEALRLMLELEQNDQGKQCQWRAWALWKARAALEMVERAEKDVKRG